MAVSRKHFEMVAASLKDALDVGLDRNTIAYLAGRFIVEFEDANPRFNSERFIKATGLAG